MAIDDLLDEHEQGERVREWVRRNALGILGGIIVALLLVYGWRWWQGQQQAARMAQADAYMAASEALAAGDTDRARALAGEAGLGEGVLGTLHALDLAGAQVAAGKPADALATLDAAKGGGPVLGDIVARRRAALQVELGKAEDALKTLGDADDAASLEVRGDAEYALGKADVARDAYTRALARLDSAAAGQRSVLELKLMQAGGTPAKPEAES
jgi:predicted negative regulator of RcsB-dependent stress response